MCGLFGWSWKKAPRKTTVRTLAASLLLQNDRRGGDSWGWYGVANNLRRVGIGYAADMQEKTLAALVAEPVVIGHTRKASTGSVVPTNCHPFDVGSIVGAHNGIVYNHRELNNNHKRTCNVDSEHIFLHLEQDRPLDDIEAYGAIAFTNRQRPDVPLFLGTFNGGELAIAGIPGVGIVWSSQKEHLERALSLAGLIGRARVTEPTEGTIWGFGRDGKPQDFGPLEVAEPHWGVSAADKAATGSSSSGRAASVGSQDDDDDGFGSRARARESLYLTHDELLELEEEIDREDREAARDRWLNG